jgi:ATP-binding cassette subfamily B (MDR/TAP) protein 1
MMIIVAIGLLAGTERTMFGVMGESLTFRVRKELIRGVIYKQLSWFDRESHAPGILTSIFSEDVSMLNGMTTEVLCTVTEAILGLILGVLLGLFYCW